VSCADARDALSALVDEALAPGERAAVEAHLGGCADCQRELEGLRATVALLRGMERPRAPAGFVDRVVAAARPEPWRRRLGRWLFFPLGVKLPMEAAAVALVAVVAVYVVHRSPELRDVGREGLAPAAPPAAPGEAWRERGAQSTDAVRPAAPPAPPSPGRPDRAASQEAPTSQSGPVDKERLYARLKDARAKTEARDGASGVGTATGETSARRADEGSAGDRSAASGNVRRGVGGESGVATSGALTGGGPPASTTTPSAPGPPTAAAPPPAPGPPAEPATRALPTPGTAAGKGGSAAESDAREEKKPESASPLARQAAKAAPGPDVSGRLAVSTPEAAERALDLLVDRLGGRRIARRPDPATPGRVLVEIEVPREALGELATGLGRIGHWVPERESAASPAPAGSPTSVRVEVSVGD